MPSHQGGGGLARYPDHHETARSQQEVLRVAFDARKNWEQELTKTISELDAAFHEMITLQQLIRILPRLQETAGRPDLTVRSRNLYSDPLQCQVQLHGLFHLFDPQGVALALFRIEGARRVSLPTRIHRAQGNRVECETGSS